MKTFHRFSWKEILNGRILRNSVGSSIKLFFSHIYVNKVNLKNHVCHINKGSKRDIC